MQQQSRSVSSLTKAPPTPLPLKEAKTLRNPKRNLGARVSFLPVLGAAPGFWKEISDRLALSRK